MYGTAGRSLALEIAGRLGLNPTILDEARRNISAREAQLAEHLAKIDADIRSLEHEQRLVGREREALAESELRLRTREQALKEKEDRVRQRIDEELETRVRAARQEIDRVVDGLRTQVEQLNAEAARRAQHGAQLPTSEAGTAKAGAHAALDTVADRIRESTDRHAGPHAIETGAAAVVGDRVTVRGLGLEGRVVAIYGSEAEIDVLGKRLRARTAELHVVGGAAVATEPRINVSVQAQAREPIGTDINVIGCRVDEALGRVERFLDDMLMSDERSVRIIHGHGTGQLRRAIGEFLQRHPLVAHHQPAPPEQGGGGVTVAELKD